MADIFDEEVPSEELIQPEEQTEQLSSPSIPDKFRGKSMEDVIAMYQEAEKLIGRQGHEIGEVRKLADDLIKRTFEPKVAQKVEDSDEEIDFFVDPKKAVERVVNSHPKLKQAEEKAAEYEKMVNLQRVKEAHPDLQDVVTDPAFAEWVQKSKIRTELYMKADKNFDFDAADELLSTFKEIRGRKQAQTPDANQIREEADKNLKKATVSTGSSQEVSRKIYRRADIMNLYLKDPARYEAMQDEIMAAYAEGRVK